MNFDQGINGTSTRWSIPSNWAWTRLGQIARIVGGGTPRTRVTGHFSSDGIPWITPADLTNFEGVYIFRGERSLSRSGYRSSGARLLPVNAVLYSTRAPIGYCVIAGTEVATSQGFRSLVLAEGILPTYIRYYLISSRSYIEGFASGTTFKEISGSKLADIDVPVAPLPEQQEIVNTLDKLTRHIGRARGELQNISELMAAYEPKVIDAAFDGLSPDFLVPLEELTDESRGIPYGIVQTGSPARNGVPTVRAGDIKDYRIEKSHLKLVHPDVAARYKRTSLLGGEVLLSIRGTVGNAAVVDPELIGCNISREVALIAPRGDLDPQYLCYYLSSSQAQSFLKRHIRGVAQSGINLEDIRRLPVPVPSLTKQKKISAQIGRALILARQAKAQYVSANDLLNKFEDSIVMKAFKGELVARVDHEQSVVKVLEEAFETIPELPDIRVVYGMGEVDISEPTEAVKIGDGLMDKTRKDVTENHLSNIISELGDNVPADELWRSSGMSIDEFYKQLKAEIREGLVIESSDKVTLSNAH